MSLIRTADRSERERVIADRIGGATAAPAVREARDMDDVHPPHELLENPHAQLAFLSYLRHAVVRCLDELDESQVRWSPVDSGTSLLGLVEHLRMAEGFWFSWVWSGSEAPFPTGEMTEEPWANAAAAYLSDGQRWDAMASQVSDMTTRAKRQTDGRDVDMGWILLHMVEETARHAGHADIIRELIDGAIGR